MNPQSTSLAALQISLESARQAGADVELWDLNHFELPMYRHKTEASPVVRRLVEAVRSADGMIWSSPLYHGTISGVFKNALDWLELLHDAKPPYLSNKVVGLISTAGGVQGLQAINTMEFAVRALRGWTMPFVVPIARSAQVFAREGNISDPKIAAQLQALGKEVVLACRRFQTNLYEIS